MDQEALQAIRELFIEERQHTARIIEEKLEDKIKPLRDSIAKLEDMPKQIKIIAEGHIGLDRNIKELQDHIAEVQTTLENAIVVKAVAK
ncbi:hypothetical protein U6B65_01410 [Oscillospiraceae bacterium MB08-C2-2]|nr:hypothetical protein U6B65_01410 [Oscillospiraceae bacterium MB08-C2-2]